MQQGPQQHILCSALILLAGWWEGHLPHKKTSTYYLQRFSIKQVQDENQWITGCPYFKKSNVKAGQIN